MYSDRNIVRSVCQIATISPTLGSVSAQSEPTLRCSLSTSLRARVNPSFSQSPRHNATRHIVLLLGYSGY